MHFEKVPFSEYKRAYIDALQLDMSKEEDESFNEWLHMEWEGIKLPTRATEGSAGYDFYLPSDIAVTKNVPCTVLTGIRASIDPGWFLLILPRSGLGFKYGMQLNNTAGVIDEDYYCADNYGHIMAKFTTSADMYLRAGDRFMQGIFLQYGLVKNDRPLNSTRAGGFGSTGA